MRKNIKNLLAAGVLIMSFQSCTAQQLVVNREVQTEADGKMMLGPQTLDRFTTQPYSDWYQKEFVEYAIDQDAVAQLKKEKINSFNITAFVGTWCEDSHREFPRLMKILKAVDYPMERLSVIAVNRKKESPNGEEGIYNIQKVPTFIVSKYGKEIGRIIEMPTSGWLERDLLEIVKKHDSSVKNLFKKAE